MVREMRQKQFRDSPSCDNCCHRCAGELEIPGFLCFGAGGFLIFFNEVCGHVRLVIATTLYHTLSSDASTLMRLRQL